MSDYDYSVKNNWRRWQWNRIIERLPIHKKDAVVLYLCGDQDMDRKIAIEKKFKPQNLIAIDIMPEKIEKVRAAGGIGMVGDICDFIIHHKGRPKIDVIVADFCCGLTSTVYTFMLSMLASSGLSKNCIVAVNLLRGRDGVHTQFSKNYTEKQLVGFDVTHLCGVDSNKHRGARFYFELARCCAIKLRASGLDNNGLMRFSDIFIAKSQVIFRKYKSNCGNMVFDSVVFNLGIIGALQSVSGAVEDPNGYRRRLGAMKAIRTMKINGRLKGTGL